VDERYQRYRRALGERALPAALVDLDLFERNIDRAVTVARETARPLRVATKSVRSLDLLRRISARASNHVVGLMAYSAREALRLAEEGFRDILVAYPVARPTEATLLARANKSGATVSVVIDDVAQLDALALGASREAGVIPVVVDVDVSLRVAGAHLGVRRSPVRTAREVVELARAVTKRGGLRFHGVMAYEAQVAGLADDSPFSRLTNPAKRWIKRRSRPEVAHTRQEIADALRAEGIALTLFNGGGTGSLADTAREPAITEVAVGSMFLGGLLFDHYRAVKPEPALSFALEVVRRPGPGMVTCFGGGYVASGAVGEDRLPRPWLPEGLSLLDMEGAGEVQTPVVIPAGVSLSLGEPVFFRHPKPGELAERFERYALVRGDSVEGEARTYRGEGLAFG